MPSYDFTSLSSHEFEQLVRDLLQADLSIRLDSFKAGRDKGIDMSGTLAAGEGVVIQCKHYANSKLSNLHSNLRKSELTKIKKLKVDMYFLVTSLGLTPNNKVELEKSIQTATKASVTILGRDDLNNLLGLYPEVEKRNFKLWLTSQAVLERMLHGTIYNTSEYYVRQIQEKYKYYVQNDSYFLAKDILTVSNYCIISGASGVGKTTLAEVLIGEYLANGYEFYYITEEDLREARAVFHTEKRQIFYYDDFLGQTRFEKRGRHEDRILLDFMDMIQRSSNGKLIMTTREYILNQAKSEYERLGRSTIDVFKCILDLEKYTMLHRAKILYNHIYFSNLPTPHRDILFEKDNILHKEQFLLIIRHKNFSPRIVEYMTSVERIKKFETPEMFVQIFLKNLEQPELIWEHAFTKHLSDASRHLLEVIVSFPREVMLEDLEIAFWSYKRLLSKQYNYPMSTMDFRSSLRELVGDFVKTQEQDEHSWVQFDNPSVRDYLEGHLLANDHILLDLCRSTTAYEQLAELMELMGLEDFPPHLEQEMLDQLVHLLDVAGSQENTIKRLNFALYFLHQTTVADGKKLLEKITREVRILLTNKLDFNAFDFLGFMIEQQHRFDSDFMTEVRRRVIDKLNTFAAFDSIYDTLEVCGSLFTDVELERMRKKFRKVARTFMQDPDSDAINYIMLLDMAKFLSDVDYYDQLLEEGLGGGREWKVDDKPQEILLKDSQQDTQQLKVENQEIVQLFSTMRDPLD